MDQAALGCALLVIGLFGGYIYLRRDETITLSFGTLSFCGGLCFTAGTNVFHLLFPFPVVEWYLFYIGLFFFPVALWAFLDGLFESSRLAVFLRLSQCHLVFALVFLILDVLGEWPFSRSVPFFLCLMMVEVALVVVVMVRYKQSFRAMNHEVRVLSTGAVGLALFGLHAILRGLNILPWDFSVFHWGAFLFILLLGYLLKRRVSEYQHQ